MNTLPTTCDAARFGVLRFGALLLVASIAAGCAGFVPQPGPPDEPPARYVDLTLPIVALGDTQEHESTGYPLHDNDSAVDAFVEVAQRPPEQPLFGRRILEWVLQRHPGSPVVHLGDVLDLSCRSEAERIERVFRDAVGNAVILPGNHDGLMFGIYGYRILDAVLDPDAKRWNHACRRGAAPDDDRHRTTNEALSKRGFIGLLLEQHRRRPHVAPGLAAPPERGDYRVSWRHPDPQAFLSAIEANVLDGYRYADSFLAQRLRLPAAPGATRGVVVVALDTNQAGALVGTWDTIMGRSPGSAGHVHPDQIVAVRPWLLEATRRGDIVAFAGHHDWNSLGQPTRLMLRNLMADLPHPLVYLSAHTHRGFWAEHRSLDNRPLLELNVSSLSDWPIAYRRIAFAYDEHGKRLLVRGELMPNAGRTLRSDADLLAAWESQACARIGPEPEAFVRVDRDMVRRQRDARGSLFEWMVEALAPVCETCEQPLFRHAQAYQDAMLETILQLASHLGSRAHRLHEVRLPAWCDGADFFDCSRRLQAASADGFASHVALFRRKAQLVDLLSNHLDDLRSPQAGAYMACRAVQAAKIDFDLTPDDRNAHRGEANRRAEQFFRVEASVGNE
jgi:hypothetical protein